MDEGLIRVFNKQQGKTSLGTKIIGKKIYSYDWVTSTNDIAHFLAVGGEPEGSLVFAKGQTKRKRISRVLRPDNLVKGQEF